MIQILDPSIYNNLLDRLFINTEEYYGLYGDDNRHSVSANVKVIGIEPGIVCIRMSYNA